MIKWTTAVLIALLLPAAISAQQQGVKVRGQWAVDVRQPDGTLVQHVEFDNALAANGMSVLARLLTKQSVAGLWEIAVWASGGTGLCSLNGPSVCYVQDPGMTTVANPKAHFRNLTVTNTTVNGSNGPSNISVVLSGHFVADHTGLMGLVQTRLGTCDASRTAAECSPIHGEPVASSPNFTSHQLPQPIAVTKDQIVQIKVTLTFS